MDERDEQSATITTNTDSELKELLGLFDVPAFARRGQDLEYSLSRLYARCQRERMGMLDMVRVRLRQWAGVVVGPESWGNVFTAPLDPLWTLSHAEPPAWAVRPAPFRRQRAIARDLISSINRFNRRWAQFLSDLDLETVNRLIDQYNRYYLLEKECSLGSSRLAARYYTPIQRLTREGLIAEYPSLPVPELIV